MKKTASLFLLSLTWTGCSSVPTKTDPVETTVLVAPGAVAEGHSFETAEIRVTLVEAQDKTAVVLVEKRFDRINGILKQYYTVTDGDLLGREEKIARDNNEVIALDFTTGLKVAQVDRDMVRCQAQRRETLPDQDGRPAYRVYYVEEDRPRAFVLLEDVATGKRFKIIGKLN